MEIPQKIKHRITLWPSNYPTRHLSKEYKSADSRGTCTSTFIEALSTIAKLWKEPKFPSTNKWIKMFYIYVGVYTHTHKHTHTNEILLSNQRKWNLAICNNMDGTGVYIEWNKSEKDKYHMISLICGI